VLFLFFYPARKEIMGALTLETMLIPLPFLGLQTRYLTKKRVTRVGHLLLDPMSDMCKDRDYQKALSELGLTFNTEVSNSLQAEFEAEEAKLRKMICGIWHFRSQCRHCENGMWIAEKNGPQLCTGCGSISSSQRSKANRSNGTQCQSQMAYQGNSFS
jgi:hypothetical protein